MISDQLIDNTITLRDLLAQAVCMGVRAGRGQIDYTSGPWQIADDILNETPEVIRHRNSILDIRQIMVSVVAAASTDISE